MAPIQLHRDSQLEAGLLRSTTEEKRTGSTAPGTLERTRSAQLAPTRKMSPLRRVLLVVGVGFALGLGVVSARPSLVACGSKHQEAKVDMANGRMTDPELAKALQLASPDVLHRLLHAYLPERYQHGVYASDRDAIDAIHQHNPTVASALVKIAKRQEDTASSNSTASTTVSVDSATTTLATEPATTSDAAPPKTTSSDSPSAVASPTSDAPATSAASTVSEESTISKAPSETTTSSAEAPGASATTSAPEATSSGTPTTEETPSSSDVFSTSAPESASTSGRLAPTSRAPSLTLTTSITSDTLPPSSSHSTTSSPQFGPSIITTTTTTTTTTQSADIALSTESFTDPSTVSSTPALETITSGTKTTSTPVPHTLTTTLPDGGTTTLTSTSWVAVVPTGSSDDSKSPDLQNAASLPRAKMAMPAAIGLLVGAVLMA